MRIKYKVDLKKMDENYLLWKKLIIIRDSVSNFGICSLSPRALKSDPVYLICASFLDKLWTYPLSDGVYATTQQCYVTMCSSLSCRLFKSILEHVNLKSAKIIKNSYGCFSWKLYSKIESLDYYESSLK